MLGLLLLAACSVQGTVDATRQAQSFLELFPEASYKEVSFSVAETDVLKDVITQECGALNLTQVTRATYTAPAATFSAYVQDGEVICVSSKLNQEAFDVRQGDPSTVAAGTLVTVNGEPITQADVTAAAATLAPSLRNNTDQSTLVNQLIDRALLEQAAEDIPIGDEEVTAAAEDAWSAAGFADQQSFVDSLTISYNEYLDEIRTQLQVQRLLEQRGITNVSVQPQAAMEFYLNNPNVFLVSEQARFRQLFVSKDRGRDAAVERFEQILQQNVSFCDAVRRYSDDVDSRETCGEYVTPRGVIAPVLDAAVFSLPPGEQSVVESDAGFHIIIVVERQPTQVIPYAQAEQQVLGLMRQNAVQERLSIYLLKLRADADLVQYQ